MEKSSNTLLRILIVVTILFLIGLIIFLFYCRCRKDITSGPVHGSESYTELITAKAEPVRVEGAQYPPIDIKCEDVNDDKARLVPIGPIRGNLSPMNNRIDLFKLEKNVADIPQGGAGDPVVFSEYTPFGTRVNFAGIPPDMSGAQNGNVVIMSGNTFAALSTDGGGTYTALNPSTIFPSGPTSDAAGNLLDGGLCCDQILQYVPQIDRFIWLMQFSGTCGGLCGTNKFRIASASTQDVIGSNGTAWTYWDFSSALFGMTNTMDYPDMSFGNNSLYVSIDAVGTGLLVVRIPLSEIEKSVTVNLQYTNITDGGVAYGGHISQNTGDEVYWAGHNNTSQIRVFSMKEGENRYSWRDININSWQNGTISSNTPGNINWLAFGFPGNAVLGATRRNNEVWFAWTASAGGGFQNPHVQVAKFSLPNYNLIEQMQIWNNDYAFSYPAFATNSDNEVGISLAWGGRNFFGNHAVGIMGDFVVWYPELSDTAITRWGDYVSNRRANPQSRMFAASGYAVLKNTPPATGWRFDPYYILYGRNSVVNGGANDGIR